VNTIERLSGTPLPQGASRPIWPWAARRAAHWSTKRARIADPAGEVKPTYVKVYADAACAAAEAQDRLRAAGYVASPLAAVQAERVQVALG
jgi:hypothetical protein